jgi:hypothetical protein
MSRREGRGKTIGREEGEERGKSLVKKGQAL